MCGHIQPGFWKYARELLNFLYLISQSNYHSEIISPFYLIFSKHKPFHPPLFRHSNFHFQIQVHFHLSITFYIQPYSRLISHVDAYTTQQHCIFLANHDSRGHESQQHCILLTTHDSRVTTHENMKSNNTAYFSRLMTHDSRLTTHENMKLNDCMLLSTHDDSRVTCFRRVYMIIFYL